MSKNDMETPRATLIRKLWEAQTIGYDESARRLMAEAAQMLEEKPAKERCVWCGKDDCFSLAATTKFEVTT